MSDARTVILQILAEHDASMTDALLSDLAEALDYWASEGDSS